MAAKKLTAREEMEQYAARAAARREALSAPKRSAPAPKVGSKNLTATEAMRQSSERAAARRKAVSSSAAAPKTKPAKTNFGTTGLPKDNPLAVKGMSRTMTPAKSAAAKPAATTKPAARTSAATGPANTQKTTAPATAKPKTMPPKAEASKVSERGQMFAAARARGDATFTGPNGAKFNTRIAGESAAEHKAFLANKKPTLKKLKEIDVNTGAQPKQDEKGLQAIIDKKTGKK